MAKSVKELRNVAASKPGAEKSLARPSENPKTVAASALTQRPSKASVISQRVIKETSKTHREALKRLADR